MKIFARQIAPEFQESPLFHGDEFFPDNINVYGNDRYNEHCMEIFNTVWNVLYHGELLGEWEKLNDHGSGWYNSWAEALEDIIPPKGRAAYTRDERKNKIPELLNRFSECHSSMEESILCEVLEIITGKSWGHSTIRGCCQGDWQKVVYPSDEWTKAALEEFETEYFNTGSEWVIHDEDGEPKDLGEISGYNMYCHGWNDDQIRAEILKEAGKDGDEVILYKFDGYREIPVYTLVG